MTQTSEDPGVPTQLIPIHGRQIVVRKLNEMQLLYMAREARKLTKPNVDSDQKLSAAANLLDLLESAVVQAEDVEYLKDLTLAGRLELKDMMGMVSAFQDEAPTTGPVVRRGRGRPRKIAS